LFRSTVNYGIVKSWQCVGLEGSFEKSSYAITRSPYSTLLPERNSNQKFPRTNIYSVTLRHYFNCWCHIETVEIRCGTVIITDESEGGICYLPILKRCLCTLFVCISQAAQSTYPIVVSDWNWVTSLTNLIREQHKISETQEVKYVTMVKTRHLNGSRPFAYFPWESACAGSGMQPPN